MNKKLVGIGIAAVAVVAVILLAVFVIVPMFGGKQVTKVKDALFETLESKSMTVKVTGQFDDDELDAMKIKIEYSEDDEAFYIQLSEEDANTTLYYIIEDGAVYYAAYDKEVDKAFALCLNLGEAAEGIWSDVVLALFAGEEKFYEALEDTKLEETFKNMEMELDLDNLQELVDEMIDVFEEKDNLEECLDAETKKEDGETVYTFKPDVYKTITLAMKSVKSRFEDKDVYEDLREELKGDKDYYDDLKLKISVSVDKDVLTGIDVKIDDDGEESKVKLKFSDVGSTTVSLSDVKDALKEAKEAYEESQEDKDSEGAEDATGNAIAVPMN